MNTGHDRRALVRCHRKFIRAEPVDNVDRQLELDMLHVYGSMAAG
jgi:hypothetical protein